jgi:hypothetical protein
VIAADVHTGRPGVADHARDDVLGTAGEHPQRAAGPLLELAQAPVQEGEPGCAGRPAQGVVEHEQRDDGVAGVARRVQRGVVGQAQVAAQPQDGRHDCGR